jgi:hypothetical protein
MSMNLGPCLEAQAAFAANSPGRCDALTHAAVQSVLQRRKDRDLTAARLTRAGNTPDGPQPRAGATHLSESPSWAPILRTRRAQCAAGDIPDRRCERGSWGRGSFAIREPLRAGRPSGPYPHPLSAPTARLLPLRSRIDRAGHASTGAVTARLLVDSPGRAAARPRSPSAPVSFSSSQGIRRLRLAHP